MSAEKTNRTIAVLGQYDHGKTTLAEAIAKTVHQRCGTPERWSMTDQSVVYTVEMPSDRYAFLDCTGDSDCVKMLLTEPVSFNGAVLVVSACDGVMRNTRNHVKLARQINIPSLVVFLNKCDLCDDEELQDLVDMEIRDLLYEYDYPGDDIVILRGSASKALEDPGSRAGDAVMELIKTVNSEIRPDAELPFRMEIRNLTGFAGSGVVAEGQIGRGTVRTGDTVELSGIFEEKRKLTVAGIEVNRLNRARAEAGETAGVIFKGIGRNEIREGQTLSCPGTAACVKAFDALVYVYRQDEGGYGKPFHTGDSHKIRFGTAVSDGKLRLPQDIGSCEPGYYTKARIELEKPAVLDIGSRFVVIERNERLSGAGVVVRVHE